MSGLIHWIEQVVREKRDAASSFVIAVVALPVMGQFLAMILLAQRNPEWLALFNSEYLTTMQWLLFLNISLLILIATRSWFLREWECPFQILPTLTIFLVFSGILGVCLGFGHHDSPLIVVVIGMLIMVRALFRPSHYKPTLAVVAVLIFLFDIMVLNDLIPEAPLLAEPIYRGGELHPWWAFWTRLVFYTIAIPSLMLFFLMTRILLSKRERLSRLVGTDELTGLMNRRAFMHAFEVESHRHARSKKALSLLLCDVDYFKRINDRYGHAVGDEVLRQLARIIQQSVRSTTDYCARFGGEEFVVLLGNTELRHAQDIAEHIRWQLRNTEFEAEGKTFHVTLSIGAVEMHDHNMDKALQAADDNLYSAKDNGRDRIVATDLALNPST